MTARPDFAEAVAEIGQRLDDQQARIAHLESTLHFVKAYLTIDNRHPRVVDEIVKALKP
jgi:hypothetical protein